MSESSETTVHGGLDDRTTRGDAGAARTLLHGLVGGLVGVVLAFLPYSTLVGGAVAGYLEPGDVVAGATVGTIAGIVALAPLVLVGLSVASLPVGVTLPISLDASALPLFALGVVYVVGPGLLGGVAGTFLRTELPQRAGADG